MKTIQYLRLQQISKGRISVYYRTGEFTQSGQGNIQPLLLELGKEVWPGVVAATVFRHAEPPHKWDDVEKQSFRV